MPMVKAPFNGQLNTNEIFGAIYNMIISQQVFADNVKGAFTEFSQMFKTDGSMYGDTKLFYATDVLKSYAWGNDAEAENLLSLDRPADPECQAITIDQFRQIALTVDSYLSKRAWGDEGAFSSFNSVMLGWIRDTKKVYDATLVNSYLGTVKTEAAVNQVDIDFSDGESITNLEEKNRWEAMKIGEELANLFVNLQDVSRDYNDYGFLRSYDTSDFVIVWNSEWVNKIRKVDLPTIFHNDGIIDKFAEKVLPARYFGDINNNGGTTAATNTDVRSLIEKDYNTPGLAMNHKDYDPAKHIFPGDLLPGNTAYAANETYTTSSDIICKVVHKNAIKYMSAFEVGTSFFNARSLTENHYLTFGYSYPDYLKNYPIVEVKIV